ncbi:MAG: ABC transporter permease [Holophagaceae bacterium]|nr:ABC transporter permease [Holophagaceae bacterium]
MKDFLHAVKAEWITGRRNFLRYSPIVFATILCIPLFLFISERSGRVPPAGLLLEAVKVCMTGMVYGLPMYCFFIGILSFDNEHKQQQWKHINAQPISGTAIILAKHFYTWCYVALSPITLLALILVFFFVVKLFQPDLALGIGNPMIWLTAIKFWAVCIIAGMAIASPLNVMFSRFASYAMTAVPAVFFLFLHFLLAYMIEETRMLVSIFFPWLNCRIMGQNIYAGTSIKMWWFLPLVAWIAVSLVLNLYLQKKKPLY